LSNFAAQLPKIGRAQLRATAAALSQLLKNLRAAQLPRSFFKMQLL